MSGLMIGYLALSPLSDRFGLRWHFSPQDIFYSAALPMLLAALSMALMGLIYGACGLRRTVDRKGNLA